MITEHTSPLLTIRRHWQHHRIHYDCV